MNLHLIRYTAFLLGTTAMLVGGHASAGTTVDSGVDSGSSALTEVVVTATKRESTVQSTPISISAVGGSELKERGIVNFTALAQSTPGVSLKSEGPGQTEVEMRGMTSSGGNSPTVGFYLDDVPMTAPAGAQNGKVVIDPQIYDLNRIESLRGPQGTLYGSGSMGGTVKLITNQPKLNTSEGSVQVYGTHASLVWKPTPDLTITPSFYYQTDKQNGISAYDSVPGGQKRYQPFNVAEPNTDMVAIYSLTANYSFPGFDVTSVTADWYRRATQKQDGSEDFNNPNTGMTMASNYNLPNPGYYGPTGSGVVYSYERDPMSQFSEELRATSKGSGKLQWVTGAFFSSFISKWYLYGYSSNPSAFMDTGTGAPAVATTMWDVRSPTTVKQYALFGEATYAVTNKLKVTAGLRWYKYAYRFSEYFGGWGSALGAATPSQSGLITQNASGVNPKLNISYEFSKDLMAYATAARGFRPGGGNAPLPTTGPYWSQVFSAYGYTGTKWPSTYQPDSVWSYEIGEKARFFQRRLIINASLYYENWKDIQLESLPGDWPMNINGKYAHIFGGEIETQAILGAGFTLNLSGSYVNYKLNAGPHWQITPATKLTDVAPVTADISLNYTHELNSKYTFRSRIDTNYVSRRYSLAFPFGYSLNGEYVPVAAYSLTNLRAGVESADGWTVTAFVNNVFNKHAALEDMLQESLPDAAFNRVITNQPLTAGVDLNFKF